MEISHKITYLNDVAFVHIYVEYPDEYEFSLDFDTFKKNVSEVSTAIKKYIKENFDKTKGFTFVLILNGLIVGTLLSSEIDTLKHSTSENYVEQEISTIDTTIKGTSNDQNAIKNTGVQDEKTSEEIKKEETQSTVVQPQTPSQTSVNIPTTNPTKTVAQPKTNTTTTTTSQPKTSTSTVPAPSTQPAQATVPQQTGYTINLRLSSGQVISISLEEYVIGVVSSEMPASFNTEAIKAQAVAARTYALKNTANGATLSATTADQVYKTNSQLQTMWGSSYNTYYSKVKNAVYATKGIYMTYGGKYIDATYFSTSNGKTEDAVFVWGNSVPYLKSVSSPWDVRYT